jgi:hypothetical protein
MNKFAWLGLALASVLVACPPAVQPDFDNIPDSAEVPGGNFNGVDVYAMGARPGQRDIFLEIDNMTSTEAKLNPQRTALDKFVAAFAAKGIALHIDVGDAFGPNFDPANYNLGNASRLLPFSQSISLTPQAGFASVQELKSQHFAANRNGVFYYMVLGSSQEANGSAGSSGRAEIIGDDSMVTFGGNGWNLNTSTPEKTNQLNNIMASTMTQFGFASWWQRKQKLQTQLCQHHELYVPTRLHRTDHRHRHCRPFFPQFLWRLRVPRKRFGQQRSQQRLQN